MNLTPLFDFLRGKKTYLVAAAAILYLLVCQFADRPMSPEIMGVFGALGLTTLRAGIGGSAKLLACLLLPALLLVTPGCVRLSGPGWNYVRVGSSQIGTADITAETNGTARIRLKGYRSDGDALAEGIAAGVARGLKP